MDKSLYLSLIHDLQFKADSERDLISKQVDVAGPDSAQAKRALLDIEIALSQMKLLSRIDIDGLPGNVSKELIADLTVDFSHDSRLRRTIPSTESVQQISEGVSRAVEALVVIGRWPPDDLLD